MPKLSPETISTSLQCVESSIEAALIPSGGSRALSDSSAIAGLAPLFKAREELIAAGAEVSDDKPKKPRAQRTRGLPKNGDQKSQQTEAQ